jgi:hypothetical protein
MVVGPHSQATDWMLFLPHLLVAQLGVLWAADADAAVLSAVPDCRHRALPDPAHAVPAEALSAALMECQTETVRLPQAARLPLPVCPARELGLELAPAVVLARELMEVAALRAMVMKTEVLALATEQEQLRAVERDARALRPLAAQVLVHLEALGAPARVPPQVLPVDLPPEVIPTPSISAQADAHSRLTSPVPVLPSSTTHPGRRIFPSA